ncbi:homoserine kinase [Blattabacterium sp. (Blattella germanica) str. Bge]|uniref:homoserine kinase n=1 Tax=Blattabacterium sp. (Blattella germanica) TaxID=624186 RepID=UPI0001BB6231|nr:homoserine kinase [Blattabacterium sp. (Blattella germanica)]ACY40507.1 homoserine kinase [Blattabacterium sp. (Blattella germanica) str. Bge]
MKGIKIFSPATVANLACGFDVIGLALDFPKDEIFLYKSNKPGIRINRIHGSSLPSDPKKNVAFVALQFLLKKYQQIKEKKIGFEIELIKNIHPGSGIGSSAASSAGVVYGANILLGNPFSTIQLIRFAMEGERVASGTAHADNVAPAIMGGLTLVRSYKPLDITRLHTPNELWVSIIHPQIEIKTSDAREILKQKILMTDAIRQWGNIGALVSGLYQEDYGLISRSLEDVIVEPIRAMLIPAFYELKIRCKEIGALGGGISGSGPSVFMLSKGNHTAKKVTEVMNCVYSPLKVDYKTYTSPINQQGVKWSQIL